MRGTLGSRKIIFTTTSFLDLVGNNSVVIFFTQLSWKSDFYSKSSCCSCLSNSKKVVLGGIRLAPAAGTKNLARADQITKNNKQIKDRNNAKPTPKKHITAESLTDPL